MRKNDEIIVQGIIDKIYNMCLNENIVNYCRNLLKINRDYIFELNDKCIRAKRFVEFLEINIIDNYFTIYSTEWGTTSRRKITFFKINEDVILSFDDNEITIDGVKLINSTYKFKNNILLSANYLKKVDIEYELNRETKKIKKDEKIEIYPISEEKALKKIERDGSLEYYFTNIKINTLNDISTFGFINSRMNEQISYNLYQEKIRKLSRW